MSQSRRRWTIASLTDTGYRPHPYQLEVHNRMKRFTVLVCHRRWGKTVFAVNTLINAALKTKKKQAHFAYIAPYRVQAKGIAWLYFKRYALMVPGAKVNESELFVEFPNGARIRIFGADNAEALRGHYFDGVVFDEVSDMRPEVWGEIVRPAMADRKGWGLFIGTPKGINLFHELYTHALTSPNWYAGMYTIDDVTLPWLPSSEVLEARAAMSAAQFRQEFLCDFTASCENTLITLDLVSQAYGKHLRTDQYDRMPRVIGVDVARFGDDRSVIQTRQGLAAFEPRIYREMDNMELAAKVAEVIHSFKPEAVFVDAGRGEGVIDRLRQLGHIIIEVNFGGSPLDKQRYVNKRCEMFDSMKAWLQAGGALPNNPELKSSLVVPTYKFDAANRMQLESKEDMKKRVGFSPDPADALALTFAHPVVRRGDSRKIQMVANNAYKVI